MLTKLQDQLDFVEQSVYVCEFMLNDKKKIIDNLIQGNADDVENAWYVLDMNMSDEIRGKLFDWMYAIQFHAQGIMSIQWQKWMDQNEFMVHQYEQLVNQYAHPQSQIPGLIPVIPDGATYKSEGFMSAQEYANKHNVKLSDILVVNY